MSKLDHILNERMSRKEFLMTLGYGLISLVGITAFLNAISGDHHNKSVNSGFGSGPYGGVQNKGKKDNFGKS